MCVNHHKLSAEPTLSLKESRESLDEWRNFEQLEPDVQKLLQSTNALVVPFIGCAFNDDLVYFPKGTDELIAVLREANSSGFVADICAGDATYQELALHADVLHIAKIVIDWAIVPLTVDLVVAYIKSYLGNRFKKSRVNSTLIITNTPHNQSIELRYEGPADVYDATVNTAIASIGSGRAEIARLDELRASPGAENEHR